MAIQNQRYMLLDFFGTMVSYSRIRTEQNYPQTYEMVVSAGATMQYDDFSAAWIGCMSRLDQAHEHNLTEYSMRDVVDLFWDVAALAPISSDATDRLIAKYLEEWGNAISYPSWISSFLRRASSTHKLAIVTNTHQTSMVVDHLDRMGALSSISDIVSSVDVGFKKPHPKFYDAAMRLPDISISESVFVGDNYVADYLGPRAVGLRAYLIDPDDTYCVPDEFRLNELPDILDRVS